MTSTPRPTSTVTPASRERPADRFAVTGAGGPLDLGAAIALALKALGDLRDLPAAVHDGRLAGVLRTSLDRVPTPAPGAEPSTGAAAVAATRTACAYLATRSFEDAYLALRTAHDLLPLSRSRPT